MSKDLLSLKEGDDLGNSAWINVDQTKINKFAEATGDFQWIHVDEERCQKESPFGTTIAHGLLSASLMPAVFYDLISLDPTSQTLLNYGSDSIRFLEPVRVNDLIRYKVKLSVKEQKASGTLFKFDCEVEIKDREKPAMVGRFLMLLVGK